MRTRLGLVILAACLLGGAALTNAAESNGTTSVFAHVGVPGHPDTSIIGPDGSVIVSTNRGARGSVGPSQIYRFSPRGQLVRRYVISGQNVSGDHGTMGLALDQQGRLYVADYSPPRVLRIDLATGRQETYATIPDLPSCPTSGPKCDNGVGDSKPWPDGLAFDVTGRLLVTDLAQGTVFAVKNGGGVGSTWLQDARLTSTFGPNQLVFEPSGSLLLDITASTSPATAGRGVLFRVSVTHSGDAGSIQQIYATLPGEGPDGFALAKSGRVYLCTLVTDRIIVINPDGSEAASFSRPTSSPAFDSPSSATFLGSDLLITNLTYFTNDTSHDNVLRVHVGETGVAPLRPYVK